jgi:L-serine dehydratase
MFLSVFDIFKIGVGPSSSHTMGPMIAAARFLAKLQDGQWKRPGIGKAKSISVTLHGSLAFTGKGHATDRAVILGLCGLKPETLDFDEAIAVEAKVRRTGKIAVRGMGNLAFEPEKDLHFDYGPPLEHHANGMVFRATDDMDNLCIAENYFSVGGGFVMTETELLSRNTQKTLKQEKQERSFPFPFGTAQEMLAMGTDSGQSIAAMKRANEELVYGAELDAKLDAIWQAMDACIAKGLAGTGMLPGGLKVQRRARAIYDKLCDEQKQNSCQPHIVNDWVGVYAMAVNEENAAGGRVVTSPTNGAAGVVPAVTRYYRDHCIGANEHGIRDLLLVAAAIGGLIKHNASISGAEVGCQGEVGSAAAMAAGGLCAALGGSNEQVENAAEIALEHHLGMTCDPAAGLVQVPCIERNALGAVKAVSAASLALRGDGTHFMPLDNCVRVMLETGRDMSQKYRETSTGGIAVNLPQC